MICIRLSFPRLTLHLLYPSLLLSSLMLQPSKSPSTVSDECFICQNPPLYLSSLCSLIEQQTTYILLLYRPHTLLSRKPTTDLYSVLSDIARNALWCRRNNWTDALKSRLHYTVVPLPMEPILLSLISPKHNRLS